MTSCMADNNLKIMYCVLRIFVKSLNAHHVNIYTTALRCQSHFNLTIHIFIICCTFNYHTREILVFNNMFHATLIMNWNIIISCI